MTWFIFYLVMSPFGVMVQDSIPMDLEDCKVMAEQVNKDMEDPRTAICGTTVIEMTQPEQIPEQTETL